ncbi:FAD/NAD(P)-binding domain-containing protein [Punctularia strigosozonata HHB-11173 SS5]|uniref:FAD/NAD(P)-binding domain-containing protein n=1 Tax=Punctularia strigosozonata (strain HHB-11173) TaxID=741275 RepID=R7S3V5_PUNST|nr:FAD/NAD(P)-binding domain-containing protein [Punctularia strigosozonata HHB-11173 SS5]EIN05070.1 FAD/NAD(P)-binding domain-containing protein [Punctularia strigosozonata HHB-11173 SS5]
MLARPRPRLQLTRSLRDHVAYRYLSSAPAITSGSGDVLGRRVDKKRLVILGSGWAGYPLARKVDKKHYDVTVISDSPNFNFTPLLASTSVGTLEFNNAVESVRALPHVNYHQAWVDRIDFASKTLACQPTLRYASRQPHQQDDALSYNTVKREELQDERLPVFTMEYDILVVAVGAYSATFGIPGVKENAHFLKNVNDARAIRARILECFEIAAMPGLSDEERKRVLSFVVVGGGPTGVEWAAELHDLVSSDIPRYYPSLVPLISITLYDVAPHILGNFDSSLQAYAEKKFARDNIRIRGRRTVEKVEPGWITIKEEGRIPFGLCVWSTGLAVNPLVAAIKEIPKGQKGATLLTDERLRALDASTDNKPMRDVYAIGDCAGVAGGPVLPATAQVAQQKALHLAKELNRAAKSGDAYQPVPFEFKNRGSLAYIGGWQALVDRTSAASGLKGGNAGRMAWLIWRSAYFTMSVSVRNKILIPTYWFLNWILGRDISRF